MEKFTSFLKKKKTEEVKRVPSSLLFGSEVHFSDFPGKLFELSASTTVAATAFASSSQDGKKSRARSLPGLKMEGLLVKKQFLGVTPDSVVELQSSSRTSSSKLLIGERSLLTELCEMRCDQSKEELTLQLKGGVEKKYHLVSHCTDCVEYLREQLKSQGLHLRSQSSPKDRALNIATAQNLLDVVESLECQFVLEPSHHLVLEVMTLLRHAVEFFGEANDRRYVSAVENIQSFLQRKDVLDVLNDYLSGGGQLGGESDAEAVKGEDRFIVQQTVAPPPSLPAPSHSARVASSPTPLPEPIVTRPASVRFERLKSISEDGPVALETAGEKLDEDTLQELLRLRRLSRATSFIRREFTLFNGSKGDYDPEDTQEEEEEEDTVSMARKLDPSAETATASLDLKVVPSELSLEDDALEKGLIDLLASLYRELDGIISDYEIKEPLQHHEPTESEGEKLATEGEEEGMDLCQG